MTIDWIKHVTVNGQDYVVEAVARTETQARKKAREMGLRFCHLPAHSRRRPYLVLRPAGSAGIPVPKADPIPFF